MKIVRCSTDGFTRWSELRQELWPDTSLAEHQGETSGQLEQPERFAQFLAQERGTTIGFAEASLRQDYVNGTETSPVVFLEGLYVQPAARRRGAGRALVEAVSTWAWECGVTELASDVALDNLLSQRVHRDLGFEETERVVYYRRVIG